METGLYERDANTILRKGGQERSHVPVSSQLQAPKSQDPSSSDAHSRPNRIQNPQDAKSPSSLADFGTTDISDSQPYVSLMQPYLIESLYDPYKP